MVKKWAYYNEWDKGAAEWLRQLIKLGAIMDGEVDERSITDVCADDVRGFVRQHWFAGVGGWEAALQRAGWPVDKPATTCSCPCQPYSCAGKGLAHKDERDLWPAMFRLIRECRPETVLGEQVASAEVVGNELEASFALAVQRGDYAAANGLAHRLARSSSLGYQKRWLDRLRSDLEGEGYLVRNAILGAHSSGADHQRQRLYWAASRGAAGRLANAPIVGRESQPHVRSAELLGEVSAEAECLVSTGASRTGTCRLADAEGCGGGASRTAGEHGARGADGAGGSGEPRGLADAEGGGLGADGRAPGIAGHAAQREPDGRMDDAEGDDERRHALPGEHRQGVTAGGSGDARGLDDAEQPGSQGHAGDVAVGRQSGRDGAQQAGPVAQTGGTRNFWSRATAHLCKDGKFRRFESGVRALAHGGEGDLGHGGDIGISGAGVSEGGEGSEAKALTGIHPLVATFPRRHVFTGDPFSAGYVNSTPEARVMRLKGYGNGLAIETAAMFCAAILEN